MNQRILRELSRSASAMVDFHLLGKLPSCVNAPATPLRDLIEQIPPRARSEFKGVKLSPELGFNSRMQFHTLHQLYEWLGGNKKIVGNQTMPYMSWRNVNFNKKLTLQDLLKHTASIRRQLTWPVRDN
ncbi:hypothetical protein HNW13_017450 [Shewanella sp. BF02_Schw]|uniref:hypothetical protein n=1 Tax=Shewanella sp. BF02_Schw TaxID=394908 RepID=UPI0017851F89|nr:hypothetical protein [Shewanella sp. BF02_Schw]MBO1897525.1 hypothetical protein [Shewanella sp. BF02_Schw]